MKRPEWNEYFIELASVVAKRGTCLRRIYGAVIVKDNKILSTGYCGSPIGERNCSDIGICQRQKLNIPSGERYELCRSVHAEANAIIQANYRDMEGATIYVAGWDIENTTKEDMELGVIKMAEAKPCMMCERMILNAKIAKVVYRRSNGTIFSGLAKKMNER